MYFGFPVFLFLTLYQKRDIEQIERNRKKREREREIESEKEGWARITDLDG